MGFGVAVGVGMGDGVGTGEAVGCGVDVGLDAGVGICVARGEEASAREPAGGGVMSEREVDAAVLDGKAAGSVGVG